MKPHPSTPYRPQTGIPPGFSRIAKLAAIGCALLLVAVPLSADAKIDGGPVPDAGGNVDNKAPIVLALAPGAARLENDGTHTILLRGSVRDANGEKDIVSLHLGLTGPTTSSSLRSLVKADTDASVEPAFGLDGWKVWTGADPKDGVLSFAYQFPVAAFAPAGAYAWRLIVADDKDNQGNLSTEVLIENFSQVTLHAEPVYANGTMAPTPTWGGWKATPGERNVTSATFLKITNTGAKPDVAAVLDFNELGFGGAVDPDFEVPINGNLAFAVWEDSTPSATAPSEGAFVFQPASSQGSVTVRFTGAGDVVYVQYRILQMPDILADQAYRASLTLTEVAS